MGHITNVSSMIRDVEKDRNTMYNALRKKIKKGLKKED